MRIIMITNVRSEYGAYFALFNCSQFLLLHNIGMEDHMPQLGWFYLRVIRIIVIELLYTSCNFKLKWKYLYLTFVELRRIIKIMKVLLLVGVN